MLILFKMKTRWHHLVTYAASRCLPPPQPQSMSTPLLHFLVDCRLSPSSWPTSASSISLPPPSPLYCCAFLLLLYPFSVKATYFSASSPSPPASPPPSPSPSYLHRILFDCCVLTVVVVVWLPCLSFDSSSFSMEPPPPCLSTSHSRLLLHPRSNLFLSP